MTANRKPRRRFSIQIQFTLIFFFLMLGAFSVCWIINSTFLERYYIREKRIALTDMYRTVNEAVMSDDSVSDALNEQIARISGKENISLIVMDSESSAVKVNAPDSTAIVGRMYDNLFGDTPDIEQKGEVKSRYYVVQELISEDTYRISIIYDDVLGTKNMELFGMLDDGIVVVDLLLDEVQMMDAFEAVLNGYLRK